MSFRRAFAPTEARAASSGSVCHFRQLIELFPFAEYSANPGPVASSRIQIATILIVTDLISYPWRVICVA